MVSIGFLVATQVATNNLESDVQHSNMSLLDPHSNICPRPVRDRLQIMSATKGRVGGVCKSMTITDKGGEEGQVNADNSFKKRGEGGEGWSGEY